jgi:prepilin-type N-terminal cleavage/methylation domain-containing protein
MMAIRRRLREESGFTLIELLVAALMLGLVVVAASSLFVSGSDASLYVQRQAQMISVADQQIEKIREQVKEQGFGKLAMSTNPTSLAGANASYASTLQTDPNYFVRTSANCGGSSGYEYLIQANYNNTSENAVGNPNPMYSGKPGVDSWKSCLSSAEPLEILSGGFVTSQQPSVPVGSGTATVDTYVTDTYVGCNGGGFGGCPTVTNGTVQCDAATNPGFPTSTSTSTVCADARRVIVAVAMSNSGSANKGPTAPVYVSTVFTNPTPSNAPSSSIGLSLGLNLG